MGEDDLPMYTYKCYYHPKADSEQPCKGCKLPICVECTGTQGFCRECVQKREAVQQLRQMRAAIAAKPKASTTTARLRAARRQVNGHRTPSRVLSPSGALEAPRAKTLPLTDGPFPGTGSLSVPPASRPRAPKAPQERRYNPNVAYQSPTAQPRKRRVVARPAAPQPAAREFPWFMPFLVGIGVGVLLMVATLLVSPFLKGPTHVKPKPAFTLFTPAEKAAMQQVLNTEVVDTLKDVDTVHAAPRPELAAPAPRYTGSRRAPVARRAHARYSARARRAASVKRKPTLEEAMVFSVAPTGLR